MMTPRQFVSTTIMGAEGGLSVDPKDPGNFYNGKLVGSKFGVTGSALAAYRKVKTITAAQMAALTKDEAVDIAMSLYYDKPNMHLLAWNPVTASIVDMGYNAGPSQAAKMLQRLIAVADDGQIGSYTANAYKQWIDSHWIEECAKRWCKARLDYYDAIIAARHVNGRYRAGWRTRAMAFMPETKFWKEFAA